MAVTAIPVVQGVASAVVPIVQGPNVWRLLRTDRDGASATEIPQMAAAAVRWFTRGKQAQGGLHELVRTGKDQWRFGNVRPLQVLSVGRKEPALPPGKALADRAKSVPGTVPSVRAQRAWWVLVRFWWRAPDAKVPFPGLTESLFGRSYKLNGADWVLDRAISPLRVTDPGDRTWGEVMSEAAADEAGTVLSTGLGAVGLLALVYLLAKR